MELLDIRDLNGRTTDEVKDRKKVHEEGDIHGTSHVFILRQNKEDPDGLPELLLQKRSEGKDSFPGCYDISSAGHIPAGDDYLESALRELEEELGIIAGPEELTFIGFHEGYAEEIFYGKPFINHEISKVYIYTGFVDINNLKLQKEEVESVKWMGLQECLEKVRKGDPAYILFPRELEMIENYWKTQRA